MKRLNGYSRGFSLLEMLLSTAILGGVMIIIGTAVNTMQNTWTRVRAKADVYRTVRVATEVMSRRLSQATLASRWEIPDNLVGSGQEAYLRESDLHFICAPAATLAGGGGSLVGHAVFFQAPLGIDDVRAQDNTTLRHERLNQTLNAWGYFVRLSNNDPERPSFLNEVGAASPRRQRFQLMEYRLPTDEMPVFDPVGNPDGRPQMATQTGQNQIRGWVANALRSTTGSRGRLSVLAENVLVFLVRPISGGTGPGTAQDVRKYDIAGDGVYDSRRHQWDPGSPLAERTRHRLPAALETTIVAAAEDSWARQGDFVVNQVRSAIEGRFGQPADFAADMRSLRRTLDDLKIEYRVISRVVPLAEGWKER
jgi:uncharacterized protein (TIGR02599 family)